MALKWEMNSAMQRSLVMRVPRREMHLISVVQGGLLVMALKMGNESSDAVLARDEQGCSSGNEMNLG